jgi:hypothetical protein
MNSDKKTRLIEEGIYARLPKELKALTENFEGREKDIVLISSIGVISNCLPKIHGIYDGDKVYPHLFAMIIAPPASGKGVMNYSMALIEPIHYKMYKDSKEKYLSFQKKAKGKKDDNNEDPVINIKILPGNISTSEVYSYLGNSNHGLLIMESEADTMSNMFKNDWGNYSDVLRKAFHHEPISISRKMENIFEFVKEPKLAIVISGTPDQLQPLIKSKENGLYSRFIIYNFDEISEFKNVFDEKTINNKEVFKSLGIKIYDSYEKLQRREDEIEFTFTRAQKKKFLDRLKPIREDILKNHSIGFIPNLHRHGLVLFRIAMIFSSLRHLENLDTVKNIECKNVDFMSALFLMKTLLSHSQYTYSTMSKEHLNLQDMKLLSSLSSEFSTEKAYSVGKGFNISKRTVTDKLQQWQKKGLIKRVKKGVYSKINVGL